MQALHDDLLATVFGGQSFGEVVKAAKANPDVSVAETSAATQRFIAQNPFFHEGLMNLPIGGGKHFRNVPFVGPGRIAKGIATGDGVEIRKGIEVTRGTWAAR
jgi:hypothetical protein